jgi:serine/threonine-protein kinase
VRYDGGAGQWQSKDLSLDGAFLTGGPLLECGTEVQLGFWLPSIDDAVEFVARARVRWHNRAGQPAKADYPPGMGIEFTSIVADDRRALRDYLEPDDSGAAPLNSTVIPNVRDVVQLPPRAATDAAAKHELVGQRVGPYQVVELLRRGRRADLFVATHVQLNRRVALKRLNPRLAVDPSVVRRFFDEARLVSKIRHPNIVAITDFLSEDTTHYYVTELVEGESLAQRVQRDGALSLERVIHIGTQLCNALQAAHEAGVVHRNLEPDHVMLTQRATRGDSVKLLGFGLAKLLETSASANAGPTIVGIDFGTPRYLAPEQLVGSTVDARTDVYALGVVLHELATGRRWLTGGSWDQVLVQQAEQRGPAFSPEEAATLPQAFRDLVDRCVNRDPEARPDSAAALADQLRRIQTGLGDAGENTWVPPAVAYAAPRRRVPPWLVMLLVGLAAVATAALALTRWLPPSSVASGEPAPDGAPPAARDDEAILGSGPPEPHEAATDLQDVRTSDAEVTDRAQRAPIPTQRAAAVASPPKSKRKAARRPAQPALPVTKSRDAPGTSAFFDQFEDQAEDQDE